MLSASVVPFASEVLVTGAIAMGLIPINPPFAPSALSERRGSAIDDSPLKTDFYRGFNYLLINILHTISSLFPGVSSL